MFFKSFQNLQENICVRVSSGESCRHLPATLIKKKVQHRCIPVNFSKFFRITYFEKHLQTFFGRKQSGFKKKITNLCNTPPPRPPPVPPKKYVSNRGVFRTQSNIEYEASRKSRRRYLAVIFIKYSFLEN